MILQRKELMDVVINKQKMEVSVMNGSKVLKTEQLDKERYGTLMRELSGSNVDMLRTATKLFRPRQYKFLNVRM